jgi:hypothetical protein
MTIRLLCGLIAIALSACSASDRNTKLRHYLEHDLGLHGENLPTAIFVITEDGCPSCDRALADLLRSRTTVPHCLFLVRAEGLAIVLKGFLSETDQVRIDDGGFKKLGILEGSGLVLLKNNKVDTVMELQVGQASQQFKRMTRLLDSLDQAHPGQKTSLREYSEMCVKLH